MRDFNAVIWDSRDVESDEPASHLGTFESFEDALDALKEYAERFPEIMPYVIKMEVVKE